LDGSGYLADPGAVAWAISRATAVPTEALAARRALVLLGEPGIGKTTVMRTHRHLLSGAGHVPDVVAPELDAFGSEERLIRNVFDSPRVRGWLAGDTELCLLLDGVDELAARLPSFPALAAEYLLGWPADRLLLRLSCRTADWPPRLDAAVRGLYGNDAAVVELLPLRRDDVRSLVGDVVDGEAFLSEVDRRGVAPFAARPLTARMLAKEFARTGSLPDRAADIYRTALLALCDDDHDRAGQGSAGSPSDRLAAVTVFGSRPTVWPGSLVDREPQDASVDDCCGDSEPSNGSSVAVTEPLVRAALGTALFTGRGGGRLGWAHATFADYLSAQWLLANELTRPQLRSLLLADDGRLYPQVRGTAAWAVASDPAGTGWLVRCDPEAFAGSLDLPDAGLRAEVVEGLLDLAAAGALRRDWRTGYGNLAHPGLADQVRRALVGGSPDVRRLAVDVASHCSLLAVRAELVSIALDPGHLHAHERSSAALAVLHMSEAEPVGDGDLLPLVHDPAVRGDDPDDELLGAALLASWPHALSTADALRHVRPPQRRNFYGSYALFVDRLAQALTADDLPAALDWLQRTGDAAAEHHLAACDFNPVVLRCPDGADTADTCLSDVQIAAVLAVSRRASFPYHLASGGVSYPGFPFLDGANMATPLLGMGTSPPADPMPKTAGYGEQFWDQWVRYAVTRDPSYDATSLDPRKPGKWQDRINRLITLQDVDDPDLRPFADSGGKLLLLHGTADELVSHRATVEYYQRMVATMGAREVQQFSRFYLIPGANHANVAPAFAAGWDSLSALDHWVTGGSAPVNPVVSDKRPDKHRTRPLCAYPTYPRYNGSGNVDFASSFTCVRSVWGDAE